MLYTLGRHRQVFWGSSVSLSLMSHSGALQLEELWCSPAQYTPTAWIQQLPLLPGWCNPEPSEAPSSRVQQSRWQPLGMPFPHVYLHTRT